MFSQQWIRLLLVMTFIMIPLYRWTPQVSGATSTSPTVGSSAGLAVTGNDLWVANSVGNSLIEFNKMNGSVVRTINSSAYGFNTPTAIATNGKYLWVANDGGASVTELNASSGSLIRVIDPTKHRFSYPLCIVYADGHVWVSSGGNVNHSAAVFELSPTDGSIVRIVTNGLYAVQSMAVIGNDVWVGNLNDTVTEFSTKNGALERVIDLRNVGSGVEPAGFVPFGPDIWVASSSSTEPGTNYSMVELHASNGQIAKTVSASSLQIDTKQGDPQAIAISGNRIWISTGVDVVEMGAKNGALIRVVNASQYGFGNLGSLLVDANKVWVENNYGASVTELSASDGGFVRVVP